MFNVVLICMNMHHLCNDINVRSGLTDLPGQSFLLDVKHAIFYPPVAD